MEPRSERLFHPEPACFFHKDKERGLKRILRIVLIDENVPADSQDHRPVPLDERGERQFRGLAAIGHESFEKLAVRQIMNCADVEECSQLTTRCSELASRHDSVSASLLNAPVRHNLTSAADGSENPKRIEKFVVPGARRRREKRRKYESEVEARDLSNDPSLARRAGADTLRRPL